MRGSFSPPLSTSSTFAARSAPRNIVTNLAIDGHAKPGEDGVRIKMFLKIALSSEHINHPFIPLFPEENSIRIVTCAVHPLDSSGTPYAGGPKHNKLLKSASRALQLPPESTKSYLDAFVTSPGAQYNGRTSVYRQPAQASASSQPSLDVMYTGSIQVSNYAVCFVLPKQWPQRFGAESESDDLLSRSSTPSSGLRSRRSSVGGDRNSFRFMAAIEAWVPYLSVPPDSPYLLSIPVPRCLGNKLKLKIFGPPDLQHEDDDAPRWDLTTDPVVQYRNSGMQSSSRFGHVADDESFSDASEPNVNADGGVVLVQGAFQSTDRLRIRWARPLKDSESIPMDGWRRATCEKVEGKLKITVLEVLHPPSDPIICDGLRLAMEYSALCKGVLHPSVATRLALDILLDTKGQSVTWADTSGNPGWSVEGGTGYIGFDAGGRAPSTPMSLSRRTSASSFDSSSVPGSPAGSDDRASRIRISSIPVPAGAASLLNVPLPLEGVQDYSFESKPHTPGRTTSLASSSGFSSATSMTTSISGNEQQTMGMSGRVPGPSSRISIHVDMDDILPKSRQDGSKFEYSIVGVVDIQSIVRSSDPSLESQTDDDPPKTSEPIVELPVFRMFGVKEEPIQVTVISNVPNVVLHSGSSDGHHSAHQGHQLSSSTGRTRRTLRIGAPIACADDGQLSVKTVSARVSASIPKREATFSSVDSHVPTNPNLDRFDTEEEPTSVQLRMPKLDLSANRGLLTDVEETGRSSVSPSVSSGYDLITRVHVAVEPIPSSTKHMQTHAVQVRIPAACIDAPSLDFSLRTRLSGQDEKALDVKLVYAAIGGRPVQTKVLAGGQPELGAVALPEAANSTWIRVFMGSVNGAPADIDIVYTVGQVVDKGLDELHPISPPDGTSCIAVLPSFHCRVGLLEVDIRCPRGYRLGTVHSNLSNQVIDLSGSVSLTRYSLPVSFVPQLSINIVDGSPRSSSNLARLFLRTLPLLLAVLALFMVSVQHAQIQDLHLRIISTQIKLSNGMYEDARSSHSTSGHVSMPTFKIPVVVDERSSTKAPDIETQLSIPDRVHLSLALRQLNIYEILSSFPPTFAKDAISHLFRRAWRLVRRVLHFPLRPDD